MRTDARIQSYTLDDVLGAQSLHFGVCVQLIEVAHTERQIGIRKKLHGFGLGQAHEQHFYVFLDGSFFQKVGKGMGCFLQSGISFRSAHDDAARVEVVVQRLAFAKEFWGEEDVLATRFLTDGFGIAHRDGTLETMMAFGLHFITVSITFSTAEVSKKFFTGS